GDYRTFAFGPLVPSIEADVDIAMTIGERL
ncbi:MAG: hypothetical protein K0R28_5836, partial [Paenibacillus sp.]|nr:hypothetical protein [Paenibacillus sp.]